MALHALVSACVCTLAYTLIGLSPAKSSLAGMLFALHPVHVEAVAGLVSRADLLAAALFAAALSVYASAVRQTNTNHGIPSVCSTSWAQQVIVAYLLGAASLFAKETGVTVFGAFVAVELLLVRPPTMTPRPPPAAADADGENSGEARLSRQRALASLNRRLSAGSASRTEEEGDDDADAGSSSEGLQRRHPLLQPAAEGHGRSSRSSSGSGGERDHDARSTSTGCDGSSTSLSAAAVGDGAYSPHSVGRHSDGGTAFSASSGGDKEAFGFPATTTTTPSVGRSGTSASSSIGGGGGGGSSHDHHRIARLVRRKAARKWATLTRGPLSNGSSGTGSTGDEAPYDGRKNEPPVAVFSGDEEDSSDASAAAAAGGDVSASNLVRSVLSLLRVAAREAAATASDVAWLLGLTYDGKNDGANDGDVISSSGNIVTAYTSSSGARPRLVPLRAQLPRLARITSSLVVATALLAVRLSVHAGSPLPQWTMLENQFALLQPGLLRGLSVAYTHAMYAALLLWPSNLSYYHGYPEIRPITSLDPSDGRLWAVGALYATLLLWLWRCIRARDAAGLFAACALGLGPFLPAANVVLFVGAEVAERLLYLPSVGACILAARALPTGQLERVAAALASRWHQMVPTRVARWRLLRRVLPAVADDNNSDVSGGRRRSAAEVLRDGLSQLVSSGPAADNKGRSPPPVISLHRLLLLAGSQCLLLLAVLSTMAWWTLTRIGDWASEEALFERGHAVARDNVKTLNNLGVLMLGKQPQTADTLARAEALLQRAVALYPAMAPALANLGVLARIRGDVRGAFTYAWAAQAASHRSGIRVSCRNTFELGRAYFDMLSSQYGEGAMELQAWAVQAGGAPQAQLLAELTSAGRPTTLVYLAQMHLDAAVSRGCVTSDVYHYRGNIQRFTGGAKEAIQEYRMAIAMLGLSTQVRYFNPVQPGSAAAAYRRGRPNYAPGSVTAKGKGGGLQGAVAAAVSASSSGGGATVIGSQPSPPPSTSVPAAAAAAAAVADVRALLKLDGGHTASATDTNSSNSTATALNTDSNSNCTAPSSVGSAAALVPEEAPEVVLPAQTEPSLPLLDAEITLSRSSVADAMEAQLAALGVDATATSQQPGLDAGAVAGSTGTAGQPLDEASIEQLASTANMLALTYEELAPAGHRQAVAAAEEGLAAALAVAFDAVAREEAYAKHAEAVSEAESERLQRLALAHAYMRIALKLQPGQHGFHTNAGTMYTRRGHGHLAVRHMRRAVELQPGNGVCWTNYGYALERFGAPEEALRAYSRALQLLSDHPQVRANFLNLQQKLEKASGGGAGSGNVSDSSAPPVQS